MEKSVCVQEETLVLPTYPEGAREDYPMFAENRVHQRSSGNPYPNRVVQNVDRAHRADRAYRAVRLENEYLRVVVLPELGGRIYSAYDKVNGYDFFYKQHVIKPALIGLLGSWISGGVEFNWPCHHRPSTFMPCDCAVERGEDGSATVWLSEHEPLDRMKGMVGIRLTPGSCLLETRVRVYNRTPLRRSFLWWENAAVPVNEQYRLFFPPDVRHVQFHYRKDVTTYPIAQGRYNGIRMGDGTDISYHRNTRRPTSYFSAASRYDFFGGYDEGRGAGVVHVANGHISPGKKMFTWAYGQLSRSWERALTDTDGAYAELMAGSYTDNQPDFSWLEPYETKTFTQSFYPIGAMGVPECATREAAVHLDAAGICLQSVRVLAGARIEVDGVCFVRDLAPGVPVRLEAPGASRVRLTDREGNVLLSYARESAVALEMPEPLPGLPTLDALHTAQDCYLAGVHAQQYRDPAAWPDGYWEEALKKDPEHVPSLTALAEFRYEKGRYDEAEALAERAWRSVTRWNFHPESGRLPLLLGLIARARADAESAYRWFYRAAWNRDVLPQALLLLSGLDGRRGDYRAMAEHAAEALQADGRCGHARALYAIALRHLGEEARARRLLAQGLAGDPLDPLLRWLSRCADGESVSGYYAALSSDPAQTCLDVAWDLHACGEDASAVRLLEGLPEQTAMTAYTALYLGGRAARIPAGYGMAYPSRLEEEAALRARIVSCPGDVNAQWGLGCLLYAFRRYGEAAERFEAALGVQPDCVQALRALAIACYSHLGRRGEVLPLLQRALAAKPGDPQLIFEIAYVMPRLGVEPRQKAAFIRANMPQSPRDSLLVELAQAENLSGRPRAALDVLLSHTFVPCEGGEHAVAEPYMFAHYVLGRAALDEGDAKSALDHFVQAQRLPDSLGAGLWNEALITPHRYYEALCLQRLGHETQAQEIYKDLCAQQPDSFSDMYLPELPCWQAMCEMRLHHPDKARQIAAHHFERYAQARRQRDAGFYRTTPFFLSYSDDARQLRGACCDFQQAMALLAVEDVHAAPLFARAHRGDPTHLYAAYEAASGKAQKL